MKKQNQLGPMLLTAVSVLLASGAPPAAVAAPGTLAEAPLFLTNYVQPNIFYMLDDSGSMDWEIMVQGNGGRFRTNQPDGRDLADAGPIQQRVDEHSGTGDCAHGGYSGQTYVYGVEFGSNSYTDDSTDCHTADDQAWRFRNSDFNPLYFDPTKHYTPWRGTNKYNQPYRNVSITNAPDNPYEFNFDFPPGDSETIDLTLHTSGWEGGTSRDASIGNGFFFYTWSDTDNDGNFDNGEETGYQIRIVTQADINTAGWKNPDGSVKSIADLQQDFANWFSYYRKREYVAKRAISQLIDESTVRVGMSTIHNHNNVGVPVKDIDNISTPVDATADANKIDLLKRLARVNSSNGTPLRLGLRNVGNYFDQATSTGVGDLFGGTASASPILSAAQGGTCQQNFAILMSDGFWNGGSPGVGNRDEDGAGPWDGFSFADTLSNTLADVAMKFYETDLATSLPNELPVTAGIDENDAQHLVTFTVAFGINGTLTDNPPNQIDPFAWPDPLDAEDEERIDDMRHAAWNGRGRFLDARSPQELIRALDELLHDIEKRAGSAAALSFNSATLQTDTKVFQAKFDSGDWHGDVVAFDLNALIAGTTAPPLWEAADELASRNLATQPRAIVTYDGTSGIPFDWPADYQNPASGELTSAQIADLLYNAPHPSPADSNEIAANQAFGSRVVDYLRGHHDHETTAGGDFRPRNNHRLADIVHSAPTFVGAPSTPYPNDIEPGHPYSDFAQGSAKNRDGRIYVGANGGMLHAFDADTGQEVFAFVPGLLYSDQDGEGLHQLAESGYGHDYYVDLTPTVADVYLSGWKTLLVGGLRGGGKGIFVLDITNPANLTEANAANLVLGEFTHPDLGYTFSEIQVGRLKTNVNNDGRWAAVFGNGYNSTGSGRAKLFIYYLDGATPEYEVIDTGVGGIANGSCDDPASDCNGLSSPKLVDLNGDGNMDRAYAGDLKGNLWVFDLTLDGTTWNPRSAYTASGAPQPLFVACVDASSDSACDGSRQSITSKPAVARHKERRAELTEPNLMVFFGTGQYLTSGDNATTDQQRFYGVWDNGKRDFDSVDGDWVERTGSFDMSDLTAQTIGTATHATGTVRTISKNDVVYDAVKGWRIDLPLSGERSVVTPVAVGDILFFNTMIPDSSQCSRGGSGWLMSVDQLTGGEPEFAVIDLDGDGVINELVGSNNKPVGVVTNGIPTDSRFLPTGTKAVRLTTDSSGRIIAELVQPLPADSPSRRSWTGLQ